MKRKWLNKKKMADPHNGTLCSHQKSIYNMSYIVICIEKRSEGHWKEWSFLGNRISGVIFPLYLYFLNFLQWIYVTTYIVKKPNPTIKVTYGNLIISPLLTEWDPTAHEALWALVQHLFMCPSIRFTDRDITIEFMILIPRKDITKFFPGGWKIIKSHTFQPE